MENTNKKINVFDVANYIITKSKEFPNNNLTHMKLHKIIYYACVSHLIKNKQNKTKKRFILERPEAWKYGPIFGELISILSERYQKIIKGTLKGGKKSKIDTERAEIIDDILEKTKKMDAIDLSIISHHQKPWKYTFYEQLPKTKNNVISDELLIEFFSKNSLFPKIKS